VPPLLQAAVVGCALPPADLLVYEKTHDTIHVLNRGSDTRRCYSLVRKSWKGFGRRVQISRYARDSIGESKSW